MAFWLTVNSYIKVENDTNNLFSLLWNHLNASCALHHKIRVAHISDKTGSDWYPIPYRTVSGRWLILSLFTFLFWNNCSSFAILLLLLSHFSRVRLCATPSLGFSRQEKWSGFPFPSPMHKSEKWKWSLSVMSDSSLPHGLQPTRLLPPWDFPGDSTGVGCHCLLREKWYTWSYLKNRNIDKDIAYKYMDTKVRRRGWMIWEIGIDIYTLLLLYIK